MEVDDIPMVELDPSLAERGPERIARVLLHEMIHLNLNYADHDTPQWDKEVRRISRLLGEKVPDDTSLFPTGIAGALTKKRKALGEVLALSGN